MVNRLDRAPRRRSGVQSRPTVQLVFREQLNPDEGVDVQIEAPAKDGRPNGYLLGLQIKSGASYFSNPVAGGWRYSIDERHLGSWRRYSLPVVVVLNDPESDTSYWQPVRSDTLRRTAGGGHAIDIPEEQQFTGDIPTQFEELAREGLPLDERDGRAEVLRGRRAEADIGWMELLDAQLPALPRSRAGNPRRSRQRHAPPGCRVSRWSASHRTRVALGLSARCGLRR